MLVFVIFIGDTGPENKWTLMAKLRDTVNREKEGIKK